MSRARVGLVLAGFGLGLSLGCAERQADIDEPELVPICVPAGAFGYWEDGDGTFIFAEDGGTPGACTCMTKDDFWDELGFEDLLDRALESCEAAAEPYDFAWNECQQKRQDKWFPVDARAADGAFNVEQLSCDEAVPPACAVGERSPSPAWLLVVLGLLGLRPRRER